MYTDEPNISERILRLLHPAFGFLERLCPDRFAPSGQRPPHPSAMLSERNWIYNAIFPRFYQRICIDNEALERLRIAARGSTIVYVVKQIGHLEYNYFNHLFQQENLPLAIYNNAITLRRWMKWKDYWKTIIMQESEIGDLGHTRNPLEEGELPAIISKGSSVLIKIAPSGLSDDGLFFTGPIRSLIAIIEAQKKSEKPIRIVPLEFLWSRRPRKQSRSLVDVLFGEKESPGMIRKTVLFWRNYKTQAQATIGRPIDLKQFIEGGNGSTSSEQASRLRNLLLDTMTTQRQTVTGPTVKPRSWFIREVLSDDELDREICEIAAKREKEADDVRDLAGRYIREIAADVDYTYIELMDRLMGWTLKRIYENFDVDTKGLEKVKELYSEGPIIFVPNHKSHVDYLVLSHILYHHGMTVPHIASGINLSFWPLGRIFRRCGAYFIRRRFRNNPLYRAVLETYLKVLLKEGYSQEFFIEGGRSRTGKLRAPKHGMLSMLRNAARGADIAKVHLIPVSLTYDRVMEQKSYLLESEGGSKEEEKVSHLVRLTKYLRRKQRRHGSIYIRFGESIPMDTSGDDAPYIHGIARSICHQINRRAVVTPAAVAATALLAGARRGITFDDFERGAKLILDFFSHKGTELSERFLGPFRDVMNEAISQLAANRLIAIHVDSLEPYIEIDESKRPSLAFFKNGIAHFLATIGVVSNVILLRYSRGEDLPEPDLISEFESSKNLLGHEFRFATRMETKAHVDIALNFLSRRGVITRTPGGNTYPTDDGLWVLGQFVSHLRPYLETLFISFKHATGHPFDRVEERRLIRDMQDTGKDLLMLGRVQYRESVNKFDLSNTLDTLVTSRIIERCEPETEKGRQNLYTSLDNDASIETLQVALERLL